VCDRLEDGTERLEADGNIKQVRRVEEIVEVSEQREDKVPCNVQERLPTNKNTALVIRCQDFGLRLKNQVSRSWS